jgi:hypothetical protein
MMGLTLLLKEIYTPPIINFFTTYEDLMASRKEARFSALFKEAQLNTAELFTEVLSKGRGLILSEPGYGKTRFLREFTKYAKKNNARAFLIELKFYSKEMPLEDYISEQIRIVKKKQFKIRKDANMIFCLDGLDEVGQDSFYKLIREIKLMMLKYPNILFFISCRLFFYQKFQVFNEVDIAYITIEKFDFRRVATYLKASHYYKNKQRLFSEEGIDKIIQDFKEPNWESIILIPRYLEKFVEFHIKYPHLKPSKSDLYNFFINERLKIEDAKRGAQDRVIVRRLLEKIALIMEIYQKNDLTKDELVTVLEDINSNMVGNFLNIGSLEILFDHSLWTDHEKVIAFEDHSLQEYLASCELLRIGGQKFLYDIIVDRDLNEIHQSWFNTLSFCVDQDPDLLEPLIAFGQKETEKIIESEEYNRFLTKVDVSKLPKEQKIRIFRKVFEQYQRELVWIDWNIAMRLATFYDLTLNEYLKGWTKDRKTKKLPIMARYVPKGNLAQIVGFIARQANLTEKDKRFWKEVLIDYANDANENGVLQRHALFALESFKDTSIIQRVQKSFYHPSEIVRDRFIEFCIEVNPNDVVSLRYIIEGIKRGSMYAHMGLSKINHKRGIKILLNYLNKDLQLLKSIVHDEAIYEKDYGTFIQEVDKNYDKDYRNPLIDIILNSVSIHEQNSSFLRQIALVLKKHNPNIVSLICDKTLQKKDGDHYLYSLGSIFSIILSKSTIKICVSKFKKYRNWDWMLFRILEDIRITRGKEGNEIYKYGRKYLEKIYNACEKQKKSLKKVPESRQLYKRLLSKLNPEKAKYTTDLFRFFVSNYEKIEKEIKERDLKKLSNIARKVLEQFDPRQASFKILKWDKQKKNIVRYSSSSAFPLFGDCIEAADKLDIPINAAIRKNIINFIPFANFNTLGKLLTLTPNIKESELAFLIRIYNSDNQKRYFRPSNLIKLAREKKLSFIIPILKKFVSDEKLTNYDRRESLKYLGNLGVDLKYFQEISKKYKGKNRELRDMANGLLVDKFEDESAIRWRLSEIKRRRFMFSAPKGGHFVGEQEHELHEKRFAKPLTNLSNGNFIAQYIGLLNFSFKLLNKNKEYWPYVQYIWEIVTGYIDNLKFKGDYKPIKELEEYVRKNVSEEGINWFKNRLKEIKRNYQFYIGRPRSINDCVKKYNHLKDKQYLDITTPVELLGLIKDVINKKLRKWIEVEGANKLFYESRKKSISEPKIQRIIQPKLSAELNLLGITTVLREPQKIDDERVDFYISYGFSPSFTIVVEIKKSVHSDLGLRTDMCQKKSFKKMKRYIEGFSANYGIFLLFNVHYNISKWDLFRNKVVEAYTKIKNLEVVGINAVTN